MAKMKYYAVRVGREGPKIYQTWEECRANVERYTGAVHRSFSTRTQAEVWLDAYQPIPVPSLSPVTISDERPRQRSSVYIHHGTASSEPAHNTAAPARSKAISSITPSMPGSFPDSSDDEQVYSMPLSTDQPVTPPTPVVPPPPVAPAIQLSSEQKRILQMVERGENVFFTGSAGTGKSVTLRAIVSLLRSKLAPDQLAITASTGIASVNIGGTTLHSWAGIGLGKEPIDNLKWKVAMNEAASKKWRRVYTLIVDEISMIDGKLFDKLEEIGRFVRYNERPFGGIQLVLSGDFCQLPPVPDRGKQGVPVPVTFAFDSHSWPKCIGRPIILEKVFRQKDRTFVNILNAMRFGTLSITAVSTMRRLSRKVTYDDGIEPTELYPTRREVDDSNRKRLAQIQKDQHIYAALDSRGYNDSGQRVTLEQMDRLLDRLVAVKELTLKVGAQVMLIKNLEQGRLVNGSLGQVVDFRTPADALKDHIDIGLAPEANDDGAHKQSASLSPKRPKAKRKEDLIPKELMQYPRLWPVVRFTDGAELLCIPQRFTVDNYLGQAEAVREQVPLILAWALSVHKSQGQTLERVRVDLERTFEKGQAYVALSRATGMDTLEVCNFHPTKVMAHPRVIEWYRGVLGGYCSDDDDFPDDIDDMLALMDD